MNARGLVDGVREDPRLDQGRKPFATLRGLGIVPAMNASTPRCLAAVLLAISALFFPGCGTGGDHATTVPGTGTVAAASPEKAVPSLEVKHVNAKGAAQALAENKQLVVLDVRTATEFQGGHIAGAKNLDFNADTFADELGKLDRQTPYLVHCAAGGRSTRALSVLRQLGFRSVTHLDGGFNAWTEAGLPQQK